MDITTSAVGPALRSLGVLKVDTLILSHPDIDHFSGAVELVEMFGVDRVVTTPLFIEAARERSSPSAAFLMSELERRGVTIEAAARGWRESLGEVEMEAIWPEGERRFEVDNDGSLALSIRGGGRRVLLTGDIQREAMAEMLETGLDVRADVVELPHHGSMTAVAQRWMAATGAGVVLQSTGPARLRNDRWAEPLAGVTRFVTARDGMAEVRIGREGEIRSSGFRGENAAESFAPAIGGDLE
jgi:competence protein ComEC